MDAITTDITLDGGEVAVIQMALEVLDQRMAEKDMPLGRDPGWQAGIEALHQKLSIAAGQLPDVEAESLAYVTDCLATGRNELAVLLGHAENSSGLSTHELTQLWLNKVVGAGLAPEAAQQFLERRLAGKDWPGIT